MSGEFAAVLERYLAKMRAREPMALYRFGDGEMMLVDGQAVGEHTQAARVDRWSAPARMTQLGRDLLTVLTVQEPWAHFGIPCPCCNEAGYRRLNTLQDKSPTFPANLFINANYPRFRAWLDEELRSAADVALVYNERAVTVISRSTMTVPDDVANRYEADREEILAKARAFARSLTPRSLVLVSAGPLSEVLIFTMWNEVPNHCYVDVGSALDELTHGHKTRPYMEPGNVYATRECPLPISRGPRERDALRGVPGMISFVINTAAMGERARNIASSAGKPHGERAALLKDQILPKVTDRADAEVFVVGDYEPGEGYSYIHSTSVALDATDALQHRAVGLAASHGDIVIFQHDDHMVGGQFFEVLHDRYEPDDSWDVLVPARWARDGDQMLRLNNGSGDGYVMGHFCIMRRAMAERTPWANVAKVFAWDVSHTMALRANGAHIKWVDDLVVWDIEGRAPGFGW